MVAASKKQKRVVGYSMDNYPNKRNIIGASHEFTYRQAPDTQLALLAVAVLNRRYLKLPFPFPHYATCEFRDFDLNPVDILHLFNGVSYGKTPWVSTFETVLPRCIETTSCHWGTDPGYAHLKDNRKVRRALEALAGDACKALITLSSCNLSMQLRMLDVFPEYAQDISTKLMHIPPPQVPIVDPAGNDNQQRTGKGINFLFVGNSFFRKGGREIVDALAFARSQGNSDIKLTIVSAMVPDSYSSITSGDDVVRARALIDENRDWIDYHGSLPNHRVLELMKTCDVGLLPSYAETYGYSVLEFQACGKPVITTNIRAFPEINNMEAGWLIPVDKNSLGEAIYETHDERLHLGEQIRSGLLACVASILSDRDTLYDKGQKAFARILTEHAPAKFEEAITRVLSKALGDS